MSQETLILADGSEVTAVHFLIVPIYGANRVACMPGLSNFNAMLTRQHPVHRTDEPESVTCPMCKMTKEYQDVAKRTAIARR